MTDQYGRTINYMRVSVTDRCNLRCRYCMPKGIQPVNHCDLLTYEELLRICRAAAELGIDRIKLTGGEPLVRQGFTAFAAAVKALPGIHQVTLTTNGLLLPESLDDLQRGGIDCINISLDTLRPCAYQAVTGVPGARVETVRSAIALCVLRGIPVKINAVLMAETLGDILPLASLAQQMPVDVRFIELMPIGNGGQVPGVSEAFALGLLRGRWPDLAPTQAKRGNGPAHYYQSGALKGSIGFISALSHKFCGDCNRIRLGSTGLLKPCLCYGTSVDLRAVIRGGAPDEALGDAIRRAVLEKPREHCFSHVQEITEHRYMSQIGG